MENKTNMTSKVTFNPPCVSVTLAVGLITFETRQIFDYINSLLIIFVVCSLGIVSNFINIMIFYKQGLDNTINITFFALAISDLGSLVTLQWSALCILPPLYNSGLPLDFPNVQYLATGWPHLCFGNITCWITAYITAERCLCIALPMKVKQLITPRRTTLIISIIYVINILSVLPEFTYAYIGWVSERNRTILSVDFRSSTSYMDGLSFIFLAILGTVSFPAVIMFTAILVVKLRQQALWRRSTAKDKRNSEVTSRRDIRTMNMVVLIACVLIVAYTPGILVSTTTFVVPSFDIVGKYANIWFVTWTFAFMAQGVNSSVNIFLYYRMSTKFKTTFHEIFKCASRIIDDGIQEPLTL